MPMMQKIKNIIFDLGGVLVDLNEQSCIEAFEAIHAPTVGDYVRDHRTEDLFWDIEIGNSTTEEFCHEARRISGTTADNERIIWAWNQLLPGIADTKKSRLLELRQCYRLFLLSNTNDMHWRRCEQFFGQDGHRVEDYFERVFLSYKMHLVKPSAEIFRQVISETGITAEETLFIDDSPANCQTACQLGIHTLLNTTADEWLHKI